MARRISLLALLLAVALLFTGCAGGPSYPTGPVAPQAEPLSAQGHYDGAQDEVLQNCRSLSLRLLQDAAEERPGEDVLLSPLSLCLALGMASNGARGDTAREFAALLGEPRRVNQVLTACLQELTASRGGAKLTQANSLWAHCRGFSPKAQFLDTISACYGAELFSADMESGETLEQMNQWVFQHTDGLIPRMAEELPPENRLSLLNALCLSARWERPFPGDHTYEEPFYREDGTEQSLPFLHDEYDSQHLLEWEGGEGVVLPYDGGRLGFLALKPREGSLPELLADLDGESLPALLENRRSGPLSLTLPKFQTESGLDLSEALERLGLRSAFAQGADFSGVSDSPLFIGEVLHRTALEVGEEGTTAAAATQVNLPLSMLPEGTTVLEFTRPFLYGVVDLETGLPLFLGVFCGNSRE